MEHDLMGSGVSMPVADTSAASAAAKIAFTLSGVKSVEDEYADPRLEVLETCSTPSDEEEAPAPDIARRVPSVASRGVDVGEE
jgi:hypothetical protein